MEPACRRMEWLDPFYKQVWEKAFADGIPISGTFELTPRCNFNCKMCYVHLKADQIPRHGRELPARDWLRIAEEARAAGTTWLCITGGEPLLHPEFPAIWEALSRMGFFLTLQTNGSLITGPMAELLERCPPRRVKITLYGTSNEVYQAVCGVEDGFDRVNDGIHTLMSLGIPVELVTSLVRENYEDRAKIAFYAYCHRLPWASTISMKPSYRGAETEVESVRLTEELEEHGLGRARQRIQKQDFLNPDRKPCTYCRDYRVGYWVLWDGTMSFCSFLPLPEISVTDLPFSEAWKKLLDYEAQWDWPEECKACAAAKVCERCAATVYGRSQGIVGLNNHFCSKIRELF